MVIPTVLRPSRIQGIGLFSSRDVEAGETVWFETPQSIRRYTEKERAEVMGTLFWDFLEKYAIVEDGIYILNMDDARFINHSEDPNIAPTDSSGKTYVAVRDIVEGEELTCDYRIFEGEGFEGF